MYGGTWPGCAACGFEEIAPLAPAAGTSVARAGQTHWWWRCGISADPSSSPQVAVEGSYAHHPPDLGKRSKRFKVGLR